MQKREHLPEHRRSLAMRLCLLAAATLFAACAAPQLNSERIAERYGSYAVTVIRQDAALRITSLESLDGERRVTRTLALVRFPDVIPAALGGVHERISNGASIGSSFRDAGWGIDKPLVHLGEIVVGGAASELATMMHIRLPATLAVHIYRFDVHRDGERYRYASIVELHHPDYLDIGRLQALYGPGPPAIDESAAGLLAELEAMLYTLPSSLAR